MGKHTRRLSQVSPAVSAQIRDLIAKDVKHKDLSTTNLPYLESLSKYSLVFPTESLNIIEDDPFIVDKRIKLSLEELKIINWCPGIKRLVPLSISNDGNSLCHAASVALWGIQDRSLDIDKESGPVLRNLIGLAMKSEQRDEFKKRWMRDAEKIMTGKLQDQELKIALEAEWKARVNIVNKASRSTNPVYDPLEEIHIFVLANILRRPIIVLSNQPIEGIDGESKASSIDGFGGIYLPLLWSSTECSKTPILLGFSENYFIPLVIFGSSNTPDSSPQVIPLTQEDNSMIDIRHTSEEESSYGEQLLKDYLNVVDIEATKSGKFTYIISAAMLTPKPSEETKILILKFLSTQDADTHEDQIDLAKEKMDQPVKVAPRRRASLFRCGNKSCLLFITNDSTFPYCTECYKINAKQSTTRRKDGSQASVTQPKGLEVECKTASCPYFASVNSFPYCQRCNVRRTAEKQREQRQSNNSSSVNAPLQELSLEEKWLKLAMGIIDEEVVSGKSTAKPDEQQLVNCMEKFTDEEYVFANQHRMIPLEENEEIAMGGVTSTRSLPQEADPRRRRSSVTGGRSLPIRRLSIEEELTARSGNEWQRRVSWVNEPCQNVGCPYFASLRTFPYCNECSSEMQNTGILLPRRKLSGTAHILSSSPQQ